MELTVAESEILLLNNPEKQAPLKQLKEKMTETRKTIEPEHLRRYDLLRRNGLGVAREAGGTCSACNLNVPVGNLNRMRRHEAPWKCPHCARFLLLSE